MLEALVALLAPLSILVAGYLLWRGSHAPGGAFQAGAVLAAAGVLLHLGGRRLPVRLAGWPVRLALGLGIATFATIAVAPVAAGQPLLSYPADWASALILGIETAAALSIGATLAALFVGERP